MITAKNYYRDMRLVDASGKCVAVIYGPHDLKDGEELPLKSLTVEGNTIRVEVERPLSLVEAVGAYHEFNTREPYKGSDKRAIYDAWKREIEKEKTQ